jgi:hypothetical protein
MPTGAGGTSECRPGARLWDPDDEDTVGEAGIGLFPLDRGRPVSR